MSAFLDELYFNWLYDQVCLSEADSPSETYVKLFHILYTKEFDWFVPNDDNRVADGTDLRREFFADQDITLKPSDRRWMELECSVLELLIGLSRRFGFMVDRDPPSCFWEMLQNLGLDKWNDESHIRSEEAHEEINEVLDRFIGRDYSANGHGGIFPLDYPREDQRDVELWYQLNAYVLERY